MNLSKRQAEKLVKGCTNNERKAQEALYKLFHSEMLRVCHSYLPDREQAAEAFNLGFLKVFQSIQNFDIEKGELGGWIRKIMIYTSIDICRKELRFSNQVNGAQDEEDYFIAPSVLDKLYFDDILTNIRTLPFATQTVFNLSVLDGFSHKEISEQLNISEGTSRWHLAEAKRKLRALLVPTGKNTARLKERSGQSQMKNSLRYLALWQKKRSQMNIDANPKSDWHNMRNLLDQHLPVQPAAAPVRPPIAKGLKILSMVLTGLSAAAMTYVFIHLSGTKNHNNKVHSYNQRLVTEKHPDVPGENSAPRQLPASISSGNADSVRKDKEASGNETLAAANTRANTSSTTTAIVNSARAVSNNKNTLAAVKKQPLSVNASSNSGTAALAKSKVGGINHPAANPMPVPVVNGRSLKTSGNAALTKPRNNNLAVNRIIQPSRSVNNNGYSKNNGKNNRPNSVDNKHRQQTGGQVKTPGAAGNSHDGRQNIAAVADDSRQLVSFIEPVPPDPEFNQSMNSFLTTKPIIVNSQFLAGKTLLGASKINKNKGQATGAKPGKNRSNKSSGPQTNSNFEWGLLTGVNSSGSFTPKKQNSNFYGSFTPDVFFGLQGTIHLNDTWAINPQVRLLNPQRLSGSYTHANGSKVDSNQLITVTDTRKIYTIDVPVLVTYKASDNFSFKAGPVISIPVKQINGSTQLSPAGISADSTYYAKVSTELKGTSWQQKLNYGLSAGASLQVKRFSFDAAWLQNLGGYQVNSGFGNYKAHPGTFQVVIGFRLSKSKR